LVDRLKFVSKRIKQNLLEGPCHSYIINSLLKQHEENNVLLSMIFQANIIVNVSKYSVYIYNDGLNNVKKSFL